MTALRIEANPIPAQSKDVACDRPTVRSSLRASTLDGTFSAVFENVVRGVLISNFLLGLGAGAFEIGMLTSIPMMAHLLQPFGAYLSERTTSRHRYCLYIYGVSRLLWLLPAAGIFAFSHGLLDAHQLSLLALVVLAISNALDSIGCASWVSWMAVLVPAKIRGRYFSFRRSLSGLAALLTIPAGGWLVSKWMGGEVEGYGVALIIAVIIGLISLGFQFRMRDVNPQEEAAAHAAIAQQSENPSAKTSLLKDRNFLTLLLFLGLWTFGLNLSAPFFNFYLLDALKLNVQWVTFYSSAVYGAYFLAIVLWGRLADRIGNRPVLLINCLLTASIPLVWIYTDSTLLSIWLILPLLHLVKGGTLAAVELCLGNIQMELAPKAGQSGYFAIAAAVMGITGALGTTAGSFLAELPGFGLSALFLLSAIVRLLSLTPLFFVKEARSHSIRQLLTTQGQRFAQIGQPVRVKV
ncbi:MAG: MFS transporter [Leptolyngbya foveolarum]|uniref:MFS transporter n=1 Tax=Leptolyngbya foveolarum TaxID=47253 RepID=A0A2W4UT12_9CYAN|nr:MAG: MFS transporter [Leptolyngbya foveolarum]